MELPRPALDWLCGALLPRVVTAIDTPTNSHRARGHNDPHNIQVVDLVELYAFEPVDLLWVIGGMVRASMLLWFWRPGSAHHDRGWVAPGLERGSHAAGAGSPPQLSPMLPPTSTVKRTQLSTAILDLGRRSSMAEQPQCRRCAFDSRRRPSSTFEARPTDDVPLGRGRLSLDSETSKGPGRRVPVVRALGGSTSPLQASCSCSGFGVPVWPKKKKTARILECFT